MNAIKQTGDNTFEINASPETMQWLSEMARVGNTDAATVLNSALLQQWGGWAGYKRRMYLLELESVQADNSQSPNEDRASEPKADKDSDFTNLDSVEDALANTVFGFLEAIVPKKDREKLAASFSEIKKRLHADQSPEAIAKEAVKRAINSDHAKCACGDPNCQNALSKEEFEAISKLVINTPIFRSQILSKRND